jgi:hypothetical protein
VTDQSARAKIRALIESGILPDMPPIVTSIAHGQIVRGQESDERCLICGNADPQVSYTYSNGRIIRLHAACDAIWQQERER